MNFLIAEREYLPGEIIVHVGNTSTEKENPGRIQVDEATFILPPKDIYHSCEPNCYIDWRTMDLKALINIPVGTTITYHYGTSEDDYRIGSFQCNCGSQNCVKNFEGFKYLSQEQRDKMKDMLSPFLIKKYYPKNRF